MAEVLPKRRAAIPARSTPWWRRGWYDQNGFSSCTFEATAGTLETSPFRLDPHVRRHLAKLKDPAFRVEGYRVAQRNDPWDGEEPTYYGSSGLSAFKAAKLLGLVPEGWEYRWGFGLDDTIDSLKALGPVAIGTDFLESWVRPKGRLEMEGESIGGHEMELLWYDEADDEVLGINSWGPWGVYGNGRFRMRRSVLGELLEAGGDSTIWVPR